MNRRARFYALVVLTAIAGLIVFAVTRESNDHALKDRERTDQSTWKVDTARQAIGRAIEIFGVWLLRKDNKPHRESLWGTNLNNRDGERCMDGRCASGRTKPYF